MEDFLFASHDLTIEFNTNVDWFMWLPERGMRHYEVVIYPIIDNLIEYMGSKWEVDGFTLNIIDDKLKFWKMEMVFSQDMQDYISLKNMVLSMFEIQNQDGDTYSVKWNIGSEDKHNLNNLLRF